MAKLILLRHGQSMWNLANLFTGWVDVPLSAQGINEAAQAGDQFADLDIDVIFTSCLMRAKQTAMIAMAQHASGKTPVMQHEDSKMHKGGFIADEQAKHNSIPAFTDWHLNERYYGQLQGMNKEEAQAKYGSEQVHTWRRSFDVPPPEGESLKMTAERTVPYFNQHVKSRLAQNQNVLLVAHGNSLRAIVMELEGLTPEQILQLELATGVPRFYSFNNGDFTLHGAPQHSLG